MKFLFTPGEYVNFFKKTLRQLFEKNNSPTDIALGVSIGVVIAIIPIYGLQTIAALGIAALLRRYKINKMAIILGSQLSIPPLAPFIFALDYGVGNIITGKSWIWIKLGSGTLAQIGRGYTIILLGSIVLAPIVFFLSYEITKKIIYSLKKSR
ncbi:DUF2062 domain-containing protein [candidate division WOR-3 bacterium]|nr:DUF2062 domain-containing protein [candidate division WOR-3 bacterium]